jgi:hypothetical protein
MVEVKIEGQVISVNKELSGKSEKYQVYKFTVEEKEDKYSQQFHIETKNKNIIDNLNVGDFIGIKAQLKGRNWTNPTGEEYNFLSISVYEASKVVTYKTKEQEPNEHLQGFVSKVIDGANSISEPVDDLPF